MIGVATVTYSLVMFMLFYALCTAPSDFCAFFQIFRPLTHVTVQPLPCTHNLPQVTHISPDLLCSLQDKTDHGTQEVMQLANRAQGFGLKLMQH